MFGNVYFHHYMLIFKIATGIIVVEPASQNSLSTRAKIVDKYEFSDISEMNDWERPTIIQERLSLADTRRCVGNHFN